MNKTIVKEAQHILINDKIILNNKIFTVHNLNFHPFFINITLKNNGDPEHFNMDYSASYNEQLTVKQ